MGLHTLSNDIITLTINDFGAELISIRNNHTNQEYLWNGNPDYWKRHSPILFPIVGSLKNNSYLYEGKEYTMSQHGFARDMEFELVEKTQNSILHRLCSNETTKKIYPFNFCLEIGYELTDSQIRVIWRVHSKDNQTMYFSIGGHPAFLCPINTNDKQEEYYLSFDGKDTLDVNYINESGLAVPKTVPLSLEQGLLPIDEHLFDRDALIIENNQAHTVSLLTPDKKPYVTLQFEAPLFGVWSPAKKHAPFVCIEPWYGRCDSQDFEGTLKDRQWGNKLESQEVFEASYNIILG